MRAKLNRNALRRGAAKALPSAHVHRKRRATVREALAGDVMRIRFDYRHMRRNVDQ